MIKNRKAKKEKRDIDLLKEYSKALEDRDYYKKSFELAQDCLDRIWHGLYGNAPICDTGNYWNCDPIIAYRVVTDHGKKKYIKMAGGGGHGGYRD